VRTSGPGDAIETADATTDLLSEEFPLVSVVMPVRNEARFLARSLGSVLRQDYPFDHMEVLVADGQSTDGSRAILERWKQEHSRLRIIDNPKRTAASGLNEALRTCRGDVIIRVDGHTDIALDYVRRCVGELQRTAAENVGGPATAVGDGAFGKAVAIATSRAFGVGNSRFRCSRREGFVDTVYLGAWFRSVFERIGLFDEDFVCNEDDEFNYRIRACGGRIFLSPRIQSCYAVRICPTSLWNQYFKFGFWKVRVMQKHILQMQARQFAPPLFVGSLLVLSLLAPFSRNCAQLLWLEASLYTGLNLVASAAVAKQSGLRSLLFLPFAFAILHFSYGLGFLRGLGHFLVRRGRPGWRPRRCRGNSAKPSKPVR
jgi:succinoglycan biosynthesis protein ExoA